MYSLPPLEQAPGSPVVPGDQRRERAGQAGLPQRHGAHCLSGWTPDPGPRQCRAGRRPVLSPGCSLGFLAGPSFQEWPSLPSMLNSLLHTAGIQGFSSGQRHSKKPFLTPRAPLPLPNRAERGPLPHPPKFHLQIPIRHLTPDLISFPHPATLS